MTNRAKTEGRKARRAVEKAVQLVARYTPKDYDGFVRREISPHELAKHIAAEKLAADVREKLAADNALHDVRASIEMIEAIDEHVVVEFLEHLVEGDDVIDDAATHQWFRKALDKHRDLCIEFDAFAEEIGDFVAAIGLGMACEQYDILFEGVVGGRPATSACLPIRRGDVSSRKCCRRASGATCSPRKSGRSRIGSNRALSLAVRTVCRKIP